MKVIRTLACVFVVACSTAAAAASPPTTSGAIAMVNLEHLAAHSPDPTTRVESLLAKSRFLADHDALYTAVALAETLPPDANTLLLRVRTRAAAHRFDDALRDLQAAQRMGADDRHIANQRAAILVATGHATQALAHLQTEVAAHPGVASHSALAGAYAALGRYEEADRHYRRALGDLRTTSPFPYAWLHFAMGVMWTEQADDARRGEIEYRQALAYLPRFAAALVYAAEIEHARGDCATAAARLALVIETTREPEALVLLGEIRQETGDEAGARQAIATAAQRYDELLAQQPLAFVDHAAEFYLGPGANPERAWLLAMRNLDNRQTPRAFALALRAAHASGRDVRELMKRMAAMPE